MSPPRSRIARQSEIHLPTAKPQSQRRAMGKTGLKLLGFTRLNTITKTRLASEVISDMLRSAIKSAQGFIPDAIRPYRYFASLARRRTGQRVIAGPFAGMRYIDRSVGSAYVPKLLGIYERELAAVIEEIIAAKPSLIVDVGAAEGYYAVGLACRLPDTRMIVFELEASGRAAIAEMAAVNGVTHRVTVLGACDPEGLRATLDGQTGVIIIMDVEGFEEMLLDPGKVPALASATILVELHDFAVPGISEEIARRFDGTHTLQRIWAEPRDASDFPWRTAVTKMLPARYIDGTVSEMRPPRMSWYVARPKG
jgi:hypothetical protein